MSSADWDGIILGAGHNALVLQAYLGKAGLKVVTLERGATAGGALTTVEDPRFPGFLHNTHAFFHRALTDMPWYRDLELERHGASYIEPELNVALILRDGRTLEWWTDFDRTLESFAVFSRRDARTLADWRGRFLPIVEEILQPESRSPPIPPERRRRLLERRPEGRLLLEVSALSPFEFVLEEFEHPVVRAGLLFFNGLREVDLRCRGFGHHIPALLASRGKAQMCRGGSAALARALGAAVRQSGGEILVDTTPRRIVVEDGRAVGVETAAGDRLPCPTLRRLRPEPPPDLPRASRRGRRAGGVAREGGRIPLQPDRAALRPRRRPGGASSVHRRTHARRMLEVWTEYAPNLRDDLIAWSCRSPLDTERAFPNMRAGDLLVGAFADGQVGFDRPFPGAGHYRGPMRGLYLCGSCCHPGGNVTGLVGYNCAQVLLGDLGLEPPWFGPSAEERLGG